MLPERILLSARLDMPSYVPVFSRPFGSWRLSVDRHLFDSNTLAAHYDRKSGKWHTTVHKHGFETAYAHLTSMVMRQPRYQQTTGPLAVLDGGIGTGAISSAFCKSVDRPMHVYGIDLSTAMLEEAAARLCPVAGTLTLSQADIADTPYADNTFDMVLVAHVFEHLGDPPFGFG